MLVVTEGTKESASGLPPRCFPRASKRVGSYGQHLDPPAIDTQASGCGYSHMFAI